MIIDLFKEAKEGAKLLTRGGEIVTLSEYNPPWCVEFVIVTDNKGHRHHLSRYGEFHFSGNKPCKDDIIKVIGE